MFQKLVQSITAGIENQGASRSLVLLVGLALFLYPFSLFFVVTGLLTESYSWTASVIIVLYGLSVLTYEISFRPARSVILEFFGIAGGLFIVEWWGVKSGFPFGNYLYTEVLGFAVAGVPLAIAVSWYTTVMITRRLAQWLLPESSNSTMTVALVAGALTVALDIVLEPMASSVSYYWLWADGVIPFQNYVSWLVLTAGAVWILQARRRLQNGGRTPVVPMMIYIMQFVLFGLTDIVNGHAGATAIGCVIIGIIVVICYLPITSAFRFRTTRQ